MDRTKPETQSGHVPRFTRLEYRDGVRVSDPIEEVQFDLLTDEPVRPVAVDGDEVPWGLPVDATARIRTGSVTVPLRINVNVRTDDGTLVASSANKTATAVDEPGGYTLELSSTPIKLFLFGEGRVRVTPDERTTSVTFPDANVVHVGARTLHEQPARTLTTTRDPADIMTVVSEFGAALKTTSAERSYPTLRGHPPLLEFGETVEIPGGRLRPDTGVAIEVPRDVTYIFPVVPLAYYLGAELRPGPTPRLVTDRGFEYPLDGHPGFERRSMRTLQQVFTMDCLTRVEGFTPVDLAERRAAERVDSLDLDYASVYDSPLAAQVETYLSVPYEDVATVAPKWRLTADVTPEVGYADVLPHLANELAYIRCTNGVEKGPTSRKPACDVTDAIDSFVRSDDCDGVVDEGDELEYTPPSTRVSQADVFELDRAETATQTFIGEGFPLGANKASRVSYERQLELRANAPTHIDVTVVCNDSEMTAEVGVGEFYGTRDLFEFDVDIRTELTCRELRAVFESDTDFVHYIGHVDQRGMQAADGYLDAETLDAVGVTAFFLNGCRTFRQGSALVDAGAIAGIVTLEDVHNSLATEVGTNVARLVNTGWPLDGALELFTTDSLVDSNYVVVGDGSVELVTADGGVPEHGVVRRRSADEFDLTIHTYPTRSYHLGSLYTPYVGNNEVRYLSSGELDTFTVDPEDLHEYLALASKPILLPGGPEEGEYSLRWSDDIDVDRLYDR